MDVGNKKVTADGTYIKPATDKISYTTMVHARVMIVSTVAYELAKAVTIAVRYSVVKRQTAQTNGYAITAACSLFLCACSVHFSCPPCRELKAQVMDYQTQQYKLLPLLATVYAYAITGDYLLALNETATSRIAESNFELLPEV